MRAMIGGTWGEKILEDRWLVVTTTNHWLTTRKENMRTFKININKQKVTYFYQLRLTCVSIELFTSKAIKFLFILLVPLIII